MNLVKVIATSDLHGELPDIPACDILLIAGDLLPDQGQDLWMINDFRPWVENNPAEQIIFIAGNHDFYFESDTWRSGQFGIKYFRAIGASYIEDELININGLKIWGTPWVENLAGWAFDGESGRARDQFSLIPDDLDILLSHAPPGGILDRVYGKSVGSSSLSSRVRIASPRINVFGHIHEEGGKSVKVGETHFFNVSYLDELYDPANAPKEIAVSE